MAMLEVTTLGISFGGLRAVDELSMKIEKGGLVGLIGPNGAGKTTVFNMLTGVYRPTDGGIRLDGQNLIGKKPHEICKMGVARTFQNIRLFCRTERSGQRKDRSAQPDHLLVRGKHVPPRLLPQKGEADGREGDGAAERVRSGRASRTTVRPTCPTASSASSRSRARSRPSPSCCCSTSRQPA